MKFKSTKDSYAGIHGFTTINHRIRVKLGLTMGEYVMLDYFYGREIRDDYNWQDMWKHIGNDGTDPSNADMTSLRERGFIKGQTGVILVTDKWKAEFDASFNEEFKEFWNAYGNIGNKETARLVFLKTRKVVDYKHLLKQNQCYDEHLAKNTWKGKMHCSTWLNPDKKRYDDKYGNEKGKEDKLKLTTKW